MISVERGQVPLRAYTTNSTAGRPPLFNDENEFAIVSLDLCGLDEAMVDERDDA
jgi:hypothetical protein